MKNLMLRVGSKIYRRLKDYFEFYNFERPHQSIEVLTRINTVN